MREIKFRAWSESFREYTMFYDVEMINKDDGIWWLCNNKTRMFQLGSRRHKLMQFTGLKENAFETGNKEIYEGDIIEFINGERLVVEWNDDTCKFQFSDGSDINDGDRYGSHKLIIGNIYENPDILNG